MVNKSSATYFGVKGSHLGCVHITALEHSETVPCTFPSAVHLSTASKGSHQGTLVRVLVFTQCKDVHTLARNKWLKSSKCEAGLRNSTPNSSILQYTYVFWITSNKHRFKNRKPKECTLNRGVNTALVFVIL